VKDLAQQGIKEITLLGQNVNSYTANHKGQNIDFPELIARFAEVAPEIRFRFTTSHPKDISDKLIETIAANDNICNHIHLAMQSGSTRVLEMMKRKYTYEHFLGRIQKIKELIPDCALSTDIIAGFPGETIDDHKQTLQAVRDIRYDGAFMFKYSPREGTKSYDMEDDVDEKEKLRRLNQIIEMQNNIALELNDAEIGKTQEVLVEGSSKRSRDDMMGRTGTNKVVVFPNNPPCKIGDLVKVKIIRTTSATLIGKRI
jgi:tRNA-2-methylthio-N6-dimethylallyladenosine synthase